MTDWLTRLRYLAAERRVRVSYHGDEELSNDQIDVGEAIAGLQAAEVLETYPDTGRGPSALLLEWDSAGRPIHVVWGIAYDQPKGPAVLVTAYRPDLTRWHDDFRTRRDD